MLISYVKLDHTLYSINYGTCIEKFFADTNFGSMFSSYIECSNVDPTTYKYNVMYTCIIILCMLHSHSMLATTVFVDLGHGLSRRGWERS